MKELFYYTGIVFWSTVGCIVIVILWAAWLILWEREVRPSIKNLWFAVAAPMSKKWGEKSYYYKWHQIYEKPGLRKFWKKRHNHYSRVAYKRLVREARKESLKKVKGAR